VRPDTAAPDRRLFIMRLAVSACFILTTGWYRLGSTPFRPELYATRFVLFWALLATFALWLLIGAPGFSAFRRHRLWVAWALCLSLLALWAFASQTWAFTRLLRPDVSASAGITWLAIALFALTVGCTASPRDIIWSLILTSTLMGVTVIAQVAQQGSLGLWTVGEFAFSVARPGASILQADGMVYLRPQALLPHPNMAGGLLALGALFAGAQSVTVPGWARMIALVCLPVLLWALLLTFSRAAWIGLAASALIVLILMRVRWRALILPASIIVVVAGLFFAQYRPLLAARAGDGGESVELRSVSDRLVFTEFALRAIAERPVTGQGIGAFPWRSAGYIRETFFDLRGDQVHQVFLATWAELGLVGFVLFAASLLFGAAAAFQQRRANAHTGGLILLAAAALFAVIGLFDHYPYSQLPFMALWWGCLASAMRLTPSDEPGKL
jgi:O-antigen ligase